MIEETMTEVMVEDVCADPYIEEMARDVSDETPYIK